MSNQSYSITQLIKKCTNLVYEIEQLKQTPALRNRAPTRALEVTFYHDSDTLECTEILWNDRYESKTTKGNLSWTYRITSKGINFVCFQEVEKDKPSWSPTVRYWDGGANDTIRIVDVPNKYKADKTMYRFHQEKIRETLSGLPAWAIAVMA